MEVKAVKVSFNSTPNLVPGEFDEEVFVPRKFPQCLATFVVTLGSFGLGCTLAWSSPAIPNLQKLQDFGPLTLVQSSWMTSLAVLGAFFSGPVAGFLVNRPGRRQTMIWMSLLLTCGWLCIGLAQDVMMIYVGRFITGITGGSFLTTIPIFVSEIAQDNLRGTLSSAMVLMLVTGILFVYTLGACVSWWVLSLICAVKPALCFVGLLFTPESPRYLLVNGRWNRAVASLKWFRGAKNLHQINPELSLLKHAVHADDKKTSESSSWTNILDPCALKPLGLTLVLMIFQQMSGVNAIQSYTVKIFQSASPTFDPYLATIIIGIVQVVFVFLSMMLVDRVGRKVLLGLSFALMTISLGTLAAFFQVKVSDVQHHQHLSWVPLVAVILFVVAYSFGLGPLPWVLFGEIISPKTKGTAAAIVTSVYWITAFAVTKTFEDLANLLGWHGYYWHLTVISILGGIFTIFLIPETKGKSQAEIQAYFSGEMEDSRQSEDYEHFRVEIDRVDFDNNLKETFSNRKP